VRYLSLAEALTIAEVVAGIEAVTLVKASGLELLDSALHAPQAEFGDEEFYPRFLDTAAVLVVRIARNHPLPDGNKRLAEPPRDPRRHSGERTLAVMCAAPTLSLQSAMWLSKRCCGRSRW